MPKLSEIVGQRRAVEQLRRGMTSGKLAHAFLFTGPSGVGKATTARALAQALNCELAPAEGCDSCEACRKLVAGLHPDLIWIAPDGQYIKIEQVRAIEPLLAYPPHEGKVRLIVLDGADQLNANAANALLKAVEEPKPRTVFVLVASAGHRVVPTLVSRCQRVRFAPLALEEVAQVLGQASERPEGERRTVAALAEGSPGRALRLLGSDQLAAAQRAVDALLGAASGSAVESLFESAAEAGKERPVALEALDLLRVWLRDVVLVAEGLHEGRLVHADRREELERMAEGRSRDALLGALRAVQAAQAALVANVNPTMTLETMVLRLRQGVWV
ncbi:MAG: DNA polymerase III subunit delta' [Deltaproteobacteria bacterium]|nr:DNA polymerase III subunit delta' [Deltaproteobacteria bacterium]